jgi:hypothetical protein
LVCPADLVLATEPNLHYAVVNISLPKADGETTNRGQSYDF